MYGEKTWKTNKMTIMATDVGQIPRVSLNANVGRQRRNKRVTILNMKRERERDEDWLLRSPTAVSFFLFFLIIKIIITFRIGSRHPFSDCILDKDPKKKIKKNKQKKTISNLV